LGSWARRARTSAARVLEMGPGFAAWVGANARQSPAGVGPAWQYPGAGVARGPIEEGFSLFGAIGRRSSVSLRCGRGGAGPEGGETIADEGLVRERDRVGRHPVSDRPCLRAAVLSAHGCTE
jgi:hypothetical protein